MCILFLSQLQSDTFLILGLIRTAKIVLNMRTFSSKIPVILVRF